MATFLEISEKEVQIVHLHPNAFIQWKDCENPPADPEIICLWEIAKDKKKNEINASKIYSPVSNLTERAKNNGDKHWTRLLYLHIHQTSW